MSSGNAVGVSVNFSEISTHPRPSKENKLWAILRMHAVSNTHFRRQHAIGNYIVDFCAPQPQLIIELHGGHYQDQQEYDVERTALVESKGYRVLRFWNSAIIHNMDGVPQVIHEALE